MIVADVTVYYLCPYMCNKEFMVTIVPSYALSYALVSLPFPDIVLSTTYYLSTRF